MLVKNLEKVKLEKINQPGLTVFSCIFKSNYFIVYPTHILVFKDENFFQKKCDNLNESVDADQILPIDSGTFFFENDVVYYLEVDDGYLKISEIEETDFTFRKLKE